MMEQEGLKPFSVVAENKQTKKKETIVLNQLDLAETLGHNLTTEQADVLTMMLYVKDRYNVSGRAYHQIAKLCKQMPIHYRLKEKIAELNHHWSIRPTPNGTAGVQQSLVDRLQIRIRKLVEVTSADAPFKMSKKVQVKLFGDGTRIGKRLHVVNFTFTLLDEGSKAYSFEGNHILAIVKVDEKYDSLKLALEDVIAEVK